MRDSGFACTTTHPIAGHDRDGRPLPPYRFAELAAGGVCSTATDLGRLLAALLRGPEGRAMARAQPGTDGAYGLGLHLQRLGDDTRMIWHDGSNRGWQSRIAGFPDRGWGIVVLTNGDGGGAVIADVLALLVRSR
jgi:CubicO group peptidase (beta-lactamase class C family)